MSRTSQLKQTYIPNLKNWALRPEGQDYKTASISEEKELKEACSGFEAIFLNTMIKSMRDTLPGNALFEDSNSMDIYTSMQSQYLAEQLSEGRESIGIKDFLYRQLKDSE